MPRPKGSCRHRNRVHRCQHWCFEGWSESEEGCSQVCPEGTDQTGSQESCGWSEGRRSSEEEWGRGCAEKAVGWKHECWRDPRKVEIIFLNLKPCGRGYKISSIRFYNRMIVSYRMKYIHFSLQASKSLPVKFQPKLTARKTMDKPNKQSNERYR